MAFYGIEVVLYFIVAWHVLYALKYVWPLLAHRAPTPGPIEDDTPTGHDTLPDLELLRGNAALLDRSRENQEISTKPFDPWTILANGLDRLTDSLGLPDDRGDIGSRGIGALFGGTVLLCAYALALLTRALLAVLQVVAWAIGKLAGGLEDPRLGTGAKVASVLLTTCGFSFDLLAS